MMRQMMVQLGASTGLLGKIPGLKQFAQMKKLAGMDLGAIFGGGGPGGMPSGMPGMGGGMPMGMGMPMPGMPGMPGAGGMGGIPGLPKGYTMPGTKSFAPPVRNKDKAKEKAKRKEARKQRKKARKKR
jgi:hypothetical protein